MSTSSHARLFSLSSRRLNFHKPPGYPWEIPHPPVPVRGKVRRLENAMFPDFAPKFTASCHPAAAMVNASQQGTSPNDWQANGQYLYRMPKKIKGLQHQKEYNYGLTMPKDFQMQNHVESMRSGEFLGPDWPYNFLGMPMWDRRRYNVSHHAMPQDESGETGVQFYPKRDHWSVNWWEQGRHRVRVFRAQFGFFAAKHAAETFRRLLEATGRCDNLRTQRQEQMLKTARKEELRLRKRKFAKVSHIRKQLKKRKAGHRWPKNPVTW